MIPKAAGTNLAYNDYYYYSASGQLWFFGGPSGAGALCGLAVSASGDAWSHANSYVSARLAYYGDIKEVTKTALAESK